VIDDERPTLPPGPCDEECSAFEVAVREHGENDARLQYLAACSAREAYLRRFVRDT
jgi:hypothetical protein